MSSNQLQNTLQLFQERNTNPYLYNENGEEKNIESNDARNYKSL